MLGNRVMRCPSTAWGFSWIKLRILRHLQASDNDQLDVHVIYDFVMYNSVLFFVYIERCRETFHHTPSV